MSLSSYLTGPFRWLRAAYPAGARRHGDIPLIALMPSPVTQIEDPPSYVPAPGGRCAAPKTQRTLRRPCPTRLKSQENAVTEIREPEPDQAVAAGSGLPMSVPRLASASGRAR